MKGFLVIDDNYFALQSVHSLLIAIEFLDVVEREKKRNGRKNEREKEINVKSEGMKN